MSPASLGLAVSTVISVRLSVAECVVVRCSRAGTSACVCVVGEEQARSQVSLASSNQLSLSVTETDLSNLTASIKRPSGLEEPCGLKRQPSGQLGQSTMIVLRELD